MELAVVFSVQFGPTQVVTLTCGTAVNSDKGHLEIREVKKLIIQQIVTNITNI